LSQPFPSPVPTPARRQAMTVYLRGLRIDAAIGIHAHERGRRQPLVVDVELLLGDHRIDRLSDTIDYDDIAALARANADVGHVELVEEYVERLGRALLEDPRVRSVRVRAEKPEAIAGAQAAGCEVTFVRE